jgi:hypothetical protein
MQFGSSHNQQFSEFLQPLVQDSEQFSQVWLFVELNDEMLHVEMQPLLIGHIEHSEQLN